MSNQKEILTRSLIAIVRKPPQHQAFPIWHVEALLNQSADLLDRCLAEMQGLEALEAARMLSDLDNQQRGKSLKTETLLRDAGKNTLESRLVSSAIEYGGRVWGYYSEAERHIHNVVSNTSGDEKLRAVATEQSYSAQREQEAAQQHARGTRKDFLDRQDPILENAFKKAHDLHKARLAAAAPGQPLAYQEQAAAAATRILRDFEDAYARLSSAALGLAALFGFKQTPTAPLAGSTDPLGDGVLWVRNAIGWLTAFMQSDQSFSITLSLRTLVDSDQWQDATNNLQRPMRFSVRVPNKLFRNHTSVRLRGISGFIVTEVLGRTPWAMTIRLPTGAKVYHAELADLTSTCEKSINQDDLPLVTLGRVEARNHCRSPEMVGMTSVRNASVIGDDSDDGFMTVRVYPPRSEHKASGDDLGDIQVEMVLVGHPL